MFVVAVTEDVCDASADDEADGECGGCCCCCAWNDIGIRVVATVVALVVQKSSCPVGWSVMLSLDWWWSPLRWPSWWPLRIVPQLEKPEFVEHSERLPAPLKPLLVYDRLVFSVA